MPEPILAPSKEAPRTSLYERRGGRRHSSNGLLEERRATRQAFSQRSPLSSPARSVQPLLAQRPHQSARTQLQMDYGHDQGTHAKKCIMQFR